MVIALGVYPKPLLKHINASAKDTLDLMYIKGEKDAKEYLGVANSIKGIKNGF